MPAALVVEILATGANLVFIILLIREKILCWPFGIAGSLLSIYLFVDARLYSRRFSTCSMRLWVSGAGCAGTGSMELDNNPMIAWRLHSALPGSWLPAALSPWGWAMVQYLTDAERPFFDAFTTIFSFVATYMEVTKVLEAWGYWLVLNLASIWLYHDRSLDIYAGLIGLYAILSVWGLISWRRTWLNQVA